MASGYVSRTQRPNTWLHRSSLRREILLANAEPSTHGPSRHFAATQQMVALGVIATVSEEGHIAISRL